jgi:hypothetical protein
MATKDDRFEVTISLNVRTVEGDAYMSSNLTYASMSYIPLVAIEAEVAELMKRLAALGQAQVTEMLGTR